MNKGSLERLPALDERFDSPDLDRNVWFPYYLPHWSSRQRSKASYSIDGKGLHLSIPEDQPLWCADKHDEPLRVSCIQSGSFSGPVGSTIGQQPYKDGLIVQEEQPEFRGYTPRYGAIEIRMKGNIDDRSMFAFWLSGFEDEPHRSGEICVAEIFGKDVRNNQSEVGIGLHKFRDPSLTEDFQTIALDIDVTELHTYVVDWRPRSLSFSVDGVPVRRIAQAPDYPVQLVIGVFDFPGKPLNGESLPGGPSMTVAHIRCVPADG